MKTILPFLALILFLSGCASTEQHGHGGVVVTKLAESDRSWDGTLLPAYPDAQPYVSIVKFTIPPHSELPWHNHPSINAGYMISGEITVTSEDGKERVVKEGEGLIELVDQWHYGRNDGDVPAEIVVVYPSREGLPLAVLKDAEE